MTTLIIKSKNETDAYISGPQGIIKDIAKCFEFRPEGYLFMPSYKVGAWDGIIRPVNAFTGEFKKGLINEVLRTAESLGHDIQLHEKDFSYLDEEIKLTSIDNISNGKGSLIEPYDYQTAGAQHVLDTKRCIITSPTGSGKSLLQYLLVKSLIEHGKKKILILVPTVGLVSQLKSDFKEYAELDESIDVDSLIHSISSGSEKDDHSKKVYISTWQSVYAIKDNTYFEKFDVVFVDECLDGDTLITMGDNSKKKIKDIKPGDIVRTLNEETSKIENNEVIKLHTNLMNSSSEKMLEIALDDGNILKITGNHKVYTRNDGWKRADMLEEGDDIIDFNIDNILDEYSDNKNYASQHTPKWFKETKGYNVDSKIDFIKLIFSKVETECSLCGKTLPDNKLIKLTYNKRPDNIFCTRKCLYKFRSNNMLGDKNNAIKMTKEQKLASYKKQSNALKQKILSGEYTPNSNNRCTNIRIKLKSNNKIINMRSSWEVLFYINNLDKNLEYEKIRIPYINKDNETKIYITDFYDPKTNTIYEIKPSCHIDEKTELKRLATENLGYKFKYITEDIIESYKINNNILKEFIINFDDVKTRFIQRKRK